MKKKIGNRESKNNSSSDSSYHIAIDIWKRKCVVCITDKDGSILEETKYENTLQEAVEKNLYKYQSRGYGFEKLMFYNHLLIATSGYLARHGAVGSGTDSGSKRGV